MLYHILSNAKTRLLAIDNIGFSSDPNNNRFGPGQRNLYLIHYIFDGKGTFNGHQLTAGQGFLIKPYSHEHYFPDKSDPWSFLWITSRDPAMEEIFEGYTREENSQIFNYDSIETVQNLTEFIKQNHNKLFSPTQIAEYFFKLYNSHSHDEAKLESNANIYYEHAVGYIQSHLFTHVTVNELTLMLGITQPHLFGIFKQCCGMSPKQYIDNAKLTEAKKLLYSTDLSVQSVASSLGYEDQFAFSRFFKKNVGICPRKYREHVSEHYSSADSESK